MKIKFISMFILIGSVANANTIRELQTEIEQKHGIEIIKSYARPVDSWYVDDADFKSFLKAFLVEAEKQGLNEGNKKRFFPVRIRFVLYPENWLSMASNVCLVCSDVGFKSNNSNIHVGHRSASGGVSFIIEHFPLEGTEEAAELELRNRAVRQAAMDKIRYIKEQGVEVQSCLFAEGSCDLDDESDIDYGTQEELLKGLINLAKAIKNGDENRSKVNIVPFAPWDWYLEDWDGYQSWNRWLVDDENETENLISEYMERLRIDSA